MKQIKGALISVFYKDGLDEIVKKLDSLGVEIYSTGGTYDYIVNLGIKAKTVEGLTSYPSILGGRVKTLHPKVFGGILSRRDNETDIQQVKADVLPFVKNPRDLDIWSNEYFLQLAQRIQWGE